MFIYLESIDISLRLCPSKIPQGTLSTIGKSQLSVMYGLIYDVRKDIGSDGQALKFILKILDLLLQVARKCH